jgi:acyl-CoA thioester hydrolase
MPNPSTAGRRHRVSDYVRWSDVDATGIICWTACPRFVEAAETEFFRAIGYPYATLWEALDIWLPRVQLHLDYRAPAGLDDRLDIDVWVGRIGRSSVRLEFLISKDGAPVVTAYLVMVAIGRSHRRPVQVPAPLRQALEPFQGAVLLS